MRSIINTNGIIIIRLIHKSTNGGCGNVSFICTEGGNIDFLSSLSRSDYKQINIHTNKQTIVTFFKEKT